MEHFVQTMILLCSGATAWLVACKGRNYRLAGFIIGLCGQPFWFYTAWTKSQWAIVILACWYSLHHLRGIRNSKHEPSLKTAG